MRKLPVVLAVVLIVTVFASACRSNGQEEQNVTTVANPIATYSSEAGIKDAVGFDMVLLPAETGFVPKQYETIDQEIAQMVYARADENTPGEVTVRMAEGNEDITGIYGVEYSYDEFYSVEANIGTYNGVHVSWFTDENYTYSITGADMDGTEFESLVATLINTVFNMEEQES